MFDGWLVTVPWGLDQEPIDITVVQQAIRNINQLLDNDLSNVTGRAEQPVVWSSGMISASGPSLSNYAVEYAEGREFDSRLNPGN